ncbi:MAG: hypothetical protein AVDCRST_MAG96-1355 [uncultured Segetibacter sp.]|uniref:Uncharacterized protein n=1 Tax=uncultured Segetibacter sp. TaxID=481133 RepID=A0A6J4SBY2_9BACT|nr:MAG: hypothetical protein AVDCRST_MAG96-1355 [uncultured Segetibacter sp.]
MILRMATETMSSWEININNFRSQRVRKQELRAQIPIVRVFFFYLQLVK